MTGPEKQFGEYASTRLSPEIWKKAKAIADKEKRTLSSMLRILIEEALEHRKRKAT